MLRQSIRKKLILPCAGVIGVYLSLCAVSGVLLMENALHIQRRPVTGRAAFHAEVSTLSTSGIQDVSVAGVDGALLKGWYVRPDRWNESSVILLHGIGDNREGVETYAQMFLGAGYAVLLPDSRAHGESGGDRVTYGLLESQDVHHWVDWLMDQSRYSQTKSTAGCAYLFGESLGAAIALQATSAAPEVCAVVAEAPFASFREIGYERIAQGTGLNVRTVRVIAWPVVEAAFLEARVRYGLDFDQASPERALAASHVPALLIAGMADENIPLRHSREILRLAGRPNELWEVLGAGHTAAASVEPAEFQARVLDWCAGHLRPPRG